MSQGKRTILEDHEGFSKTMKGTRWLKNAPGNCLRWCSFTECKGQVKWAKQPEAIVHERSRVDHFSEGDTLNRMEFQGTGFPSSQEMEPQSPLHLDLKNFSVCFRTFVQRLDLASLQPCHFGAILTTLTALQENLKNQGNCHGHFMLLWDEMKDTHFRATYGLAFVFLLFSSVRAICHACCIVQHKCMHLCAFVNS